MKFNIFGKEKRSTITQSANRNEFIQFFGLDGSSLPTVTNDSALGVPAVWAAVSFLSRTLASLPLHVYERSSDETKKLDNPLSRLLLCAPNEETTSFKWRQYFWQQVFTGGRGLTWIERSNNTVVGLWNIDPVGAKIIRNNGRTTYQVGEKTPYPAADVIDLPFMLKHDGLSHYGPLQSGAKTIQLAMSMNDYGANFFQGGGIPPLAVKGPMPSGKEALQRAQEQISESIKASRDSGIPITNLPSGYELVPIGFDPEKGQMTEARRFQVEEIARLYNLPPVFLQDLTNGTFSNTEQQDLHLVKHVVSQWACAFEQELNLKIYGMRNKSKFIKHNLDGLMRGDLTSRMDALAKGVNNAIRTPNEVRSLENLPKVPNGDDLLIQGATVPLGQQKMGNNDE